MDVDVERKIYFLKTIVIGQVFPPGLEIKLVPIMSGRLLLIFRHVELFYLCMKSEGRKVQNVLL